MSEKPQPQSDADMRLAMLLAATPGVALSMPADGLPAMAPFKPPVDRGAIPYNTAVENGPTPMERFVGTLGQFKDKALDMAPMVGTARDLARAGHEGAQGNGGMAFLHAFNALNPMSMVMPTQAGARLNPLQALANFRAGAQMPEHAARMAKEMRGQAAFEGKPISKGPRDMPWDAVQPMYTRIPANSDFGKVDPYEAALALQQAARRTPQ